MQNEKWIEVRKGGDFEGTGQKFHVDPVIARIVRNRDISGEQELQEYFHPSIAGLHEPDQLKDGQLAASIIADKIQQKKRICIIGDYDIDGIQSTYIFYHGLKKCGADIIYDIPDRLEDGYGLNQNLIDRAFANGSDTILTCDNGIAAIEEIEYAKKRNMTVIVTDHHEVPYKEQEGEKNQILPPADAVVDPKQADDRYPFPGLCGAAVAWKVLQLVMKLQGRPESEWLCYIENAAFATIGDVMVLKGENRTIVSLGLEALRQSKHVGMQALISQNQLCQEELKAYHVGFILGPCLNASGRLDTAKRALELMLEENKNEAAVLAADLVALNQNRKELTVSGVNQARDYIEEHQLMQQRVWVIFLPECHESIAGIIAGRIREQYKRPVFVLTRGKDGVKGSGRSIEAYSMYEEMSRQAALFTKFGGHPMAAGLSMKEENIETLSSRLNQDCRLTDEDLVEKVRIDVALPLGYLSEGLIQQLQILEPCGNGNEKPVFAVKNVAAERYTLIGKNKNMLKLSVYTDAGTKMDALYFGDAGEFLDYYEEKYGADAIEALGTGRNNPIRFSFVYYPQINSFQGRQTMQLVISHYA